jgi:hypothetical protein
MELGYKVKNNIDALALFDAENVLKQGKYTGEKTNNILA